MRIRGSVGEWSGSEGSGNESGAGTYAYPSTSSSIAGPSVSAGPSRSASSQAISRLTLDPAVCGAMFDPMYSIVPASTSASQAGLVQNVPLISPLDGANPFDFPLDPALGLDEGALEYLDDMDLTEGLAEEDFLVQDWTRYIWSPETGFEHLDTGYPAVSQ